MEPNPLPRFESHPRAGQEGWKGRILYPVLSRRAGGLSLGVNPFPAGKTCNFDCAYCEVSPFFERSRFDLGLLEEELELFASLLPRLWPGLLPRDLAISGDGEPTLSPDLPAILALLAEARRRWPGIYGGARLVLITNSTGFLDPQTAALLAVSAVGEGLEIWAKLDAGDEDWYRRIDRRGPPFEILFEALVSFAETTPLVLQSMFCGLAPEGGAPVEAPPEAAVSSWIGRIDELLARGARISALHLYTQARPAPLGLTAPLTDQRLATLARRLEARLAESGRALPPLRVFGAEGELDWRAPALKEGSL